MAAAGCADEHRLQGVEHDPVQGRLLGVHVAKDVLHRGVEHRAGPRSCAVHAVEEIQVHGVGADGARGLQILLPPHADRISGAAPALLQLAGEGGEPVVARRTGKDGHYRRAGAARRAAMDRAPAGQDDVVQVRGKVQVVARLGSHGRQYSHPRRAGNLQIPLGRERGRNPPRAARVLRPAAWSGE